MPNLPAAILSENKVLLFLIHSLTQHPKGRCLFKNARALLIGAWVPAGALSHLVVSSPVCKGASLLPPSFYLFLPSLFWNYELLKIKDSFP